MKELIKNEKARALIKKAVEEGIITYEEINEELGDDFPAENIEQLINEMLEQGIKIVDEEQLDELAEDELREKGIEDDFTDNEEHDDLLEDDSEDKIDENDEEHDETEEHFTEFDDEFNPEYIEDVSEDELSNEKLLNLGNSAKVDEPIKMYLREIGQVPLLTHEEERENIALFKSYLRVKLKLRDKTKDDISKKIEFGKLKKEIEETKSVEDFIKVYNSFKYLF